jgi:hypothetical protein
LKSLKSLSSALCAMAAWVCSRPVAHAHPVTVDGQSTEWLARQPNSSNLGIVARGRTLGRA